MKILLIILSVVIIIYLLNKHLSIKYGKLSISNKGHSVELQNFESTMEYVNSIIKQIETHKKLGCKYYIIRVPYEYALHPIFYTFITEKEYEMVETTQGFEFKIKL